MKMKVILGTALAAGLMSTAAVLAQGAGGPPTGAQGTAREAQEQRQHEMQERQQVGMATDVDRSRVEQQLRETERLQNRFREMEQRADQLSREMVRGRVQAGEQIRQQERSMQQLCEQLRDTAREMQRSADRVHQYLNDPTMTRDRELLVLRTWSHEEFVYLHAAGAPMRCGATEHVGMSVATEAELDALYERAAKCAERDPEVELTPRTTEDFTVVKLHAFYVRYRLPVSFEVQCFAWAPGFGPHFMPG